jgi:hypothetical protein
MKECAGICHIAVQLCKQFFCHGPKVVQADLCVMSHNRSIKLQRKSLKSQWCEILVRVHSMMYLFIVSSDRSSSTV